MQECSYVEVEDELDCSCSCRVQDGDCSGNQVYSSDLCSCRCRNVLERDQCLEQEHRFWNPDTCLCSCFSRNCSQNEVLNNQTCSCDRNIELGNEPEPESSRLASLELVTTTCLSAALVFFALLSSVLSLQLRNLRRRTAELRSSSGVSFKALETETDISSDGKTSSSLLSETRLSVSNSSSEIKQELIRQL